jgi:hypothetical protein
MTETIKAPMLCATCGCEITAGAKIMVRNDALVHIWRDDCVKALKSKVDKLQIQIGDAMTILAAQEKELSRKKGIE